MYRIIGVFGDKIKVIKYDYATSELLGTDGAYYSSYLPSNFSTYKGCLSTIHGYKWHITSSNVWSESVLNITNLNTNYISHLGTMWTNKITNSTWKIGGNTWSNIGISAMYQAYQNEIVSPTSSTTYGAKIGLMYVSDYGYAASPTYWTYIGYVYNDSSKDYRAARSQNWIFTGMFEWTISPRYGTTDHSYRIMISGYFDNDIVNNFAQGIRPTFYLTSDVVINGEHTGSASDPIRLAI